MRRPLMLLACAGLLCAPAGASAAEGDVIVRFSPTAGAAERTDARLAAGVRRDRDLGLANLEQVDPEPGVAVEDAIAALERDDDVLSAEPDVERRAFAVPNDTSFGVLWGLRNTGQTVEGRAGTPGADIRATEAWDVSTGSPSVVVAVIDTGADLDHPDLDANLRPGRDFVQDDDVPEDGNGHGTHVAGTVGAEGNNATGVTGVTWGSTVMPIRALNDRGVGSLGDLLAAIDYAVDNGADIVNLSLGADTPSDAERAAIDAAPQVLFVTAAGNGEGGPDGAGDDNDSTLIGSFPCEYPLANLVCVAASDSNDALADFSNFGDQTVDLAAPGVSIGSTFIGGRYVFLDGTSMATPYVSGAAALLLAHRPDASVADLRSAVLGSVAARPAFAGTTASGGRLDAAAALAAITPPPPPPSPPEPTIEPSPSAPPAATSAPAPAAVSIASQSPPPDVTAPLLRVASVSSRRLPTVLRQGIRVRVTCSEGCRVTAEARRGRRRVARGARSRTTAGVLRLTLRLTRAERRRLRRVRRVTLALRLTVADAAGNARVRTVRLRLRRA